MAAAAALPHGLDQQMVRNFQTALGAARNVVVLTGAGTSAESGIQTFRGADGLWREYKPTALGTLAK